MQVQTDLTGVILWLLLILGGVSYYAFRQKRANTAMQQLYDVEKEEMENEYSSFATQYDELQVQINNDSIRQKLEEEKLKTQRLLRRFPPRGLVPRGSVLRGLVLRRFCLLCHLQRTHKKKECRSHCNELHVR